MKIGTLRKSCWLCLCGMFAYFFIWLAASAFHHRLPQPGQAAELYSTESRDDLRLTYVKAIENAKKSILLIIYTLNDRPVLQALRKKAEEGLEVKVICDAGASADAPKLLGSKIQVNLRKPKGIMHQKILVIDDAAVWIGSANMTTASLKIHGNLVAGFDSPELAAMIRNKFHSLATPGPIQKTPMQEFQIGEQKVEMWFFPDNPDGDEKIRTLIRTAKKTLKVAMFTWTRKDFADEIAAAKKRGVSTEIVIDSNSALNTSQAIVQQLAGAGIPVRINTTRGLLHHKFILIDGKTLVNGSANWTHAAFKKNDDCFTVIHDLNEKQSTHMSHLWNAIIKESEVLNTCRQK